ncbi:MAG: argininosuccinate lyase [Nanoarchaeota archaeon]|nr:argininosuccinate lyase [Nanoarchaeota archaeon]
MGKKLWDKGMDVADPISAFLASDLAYDQKLVKYEVMASTAHAKMLEKIEILNNEETEKIIACLIEIKELDKQGLFQLLPEDEDVHTKVENYLSEKLGDTGKKIHTYRSRNDQVLVNQRLYNKDELNAIKNTAKKLFKLIIDFAKEHEYTAMPGYTHRQKAMLSSVGLWAGAFAESLIDDLKLLGTAYELNNLNPLGSAASYGVPANIDREFTAKELGFSKVQNNVLYCQNSRGKIESAIVSALSQVMMTLSKLSADLMLFSTHEFGYFTLGDDVATGSSIMPQKKNPDVPELIKGNASLVIGYENMIKNTVKDLPSGYNKETQVVKELIIKSFELTSNSVQAMSIVMQSLHVNKEICAASCTKELFATDYAYELVEKGIPFRDAYRKAAKEIENIEVPDLVEALKKRSHVGGTGKLGL